MTLAAIQAALRLIDELPKFFEFLESIFGQTNVLRREDAVGVLDSRTDAEVLQAAVLSLLYQALGESEIAGKGFVTCNGVQGGLRYV